MKMNPDTMVLRIGMLFFAAACAFLSTAQAQTAAPTEAEDEWQPKWFFTANEQATMLGYGMPEVAEVNLTFTCQPGQSDLEVTFYYDTQKAQAGEQVAVHLTASGFDLAFDGPAWFDENAGGLGTKGTIPLDIATRSLLIGKDALKVSARDYSENFPREHAAEPVQQFLAACDAPDSIDATDNSSVPASFDCKKAQRPIDQFICESAALRWQDLALSRSYRAARAAAQGTERYDTLLAEQRAWLKDRDRRCVGKRSLKSLQGRAGGDAHFCLSDAILARRSALQYNFDPGLNTAHIVSVGLAPIAQARPDWAQDPIRPLSGASLSPDGSLVAILLPSTAGTDQPQSDQVWLTRVGGGAPIAVTPTPDPQTPEADTAVMAIRHLAWQNNTLYVEAYLWKANGERHDTTIYSATPTGGSHQLDPVPPAIRSLLDQVDPIDMDQHLNEIPEADKDAIIPGTAQGNAHNAIWVADRAHGTVELFTSKRQQADAAPYLIAWGSWELNQYIFDAAQSRLLYPSNTGVMLFDLESRSEQLIRGTSRGDQALSVSSDGRTVAWASWQPNCDQGSLTGIDPDRPAQLCIARLGDTHTTE